MKTDLAAVSPLLKALQETILPGHGVLSVYLDTGPDRTDGPAYLFAFRDGCKALRDTTPPADQATLEAAIAEVERYLTTTFTPGKPGLALFAGGDPAYLRLIDLPVAPGDEVRWDLRPHLAPLYALLGEYERVAAVILDKERARLFTVYLGTLEERREVRDYVPGRQATGGWYALAQDHYARHREKYVLRHVQHTIDSLLTMFHAHPFDRLLVGGPDEAVALLKQHLPRSLRSRLAGTLRLEIFAGEAEVRDAVLRAADVLEQEAELQEVQELLDAATAPFAVVGLDETLAVLGEGRVHRLMLADACARSGRECMECKRLLAEGEHCPVCGGPLVAVADLGERVIARAREQGALVKVVTGGAGERLMQQDGLGAWLRY